MDHTIDVLFDIWTEGSRQEDNMCWYASEKDALLEANHFRHALESSSRTKPLSWKPFMKRSAEETIELLSKTNQLPQYSLLNCVHCLGLPSTAELKSFKRSCWFDKLEEEFNDDCEKDPCLRERFRNIFTANFYSEREARCMCQCKIRLPTQVYMVVHEDLGYLIR